MDPAGFTVHRQQDLLDPAFARRLRSVFALLALVLGVRAFSLRIESDTMSVGQHRGETEITPTLVCYLTIGPECFRG